MATEPKKTEADSGTLQQKMNEITFKNSQANMINALRNENVKLKSMLGRRNTAKRVSAAEGIVGLQRLGRQITQ